MDYSRKTKAELLREIATLRSELSRVKPPSEVRQFDEAIYKSLGSDSQANFYVIQDGKFVFVSRHASTHGGYRRGAVSLDFVHPDDREKVRQSAISMLKGKRSSSYEVRTISKNGEIRWFAESVTPILFKGRRAALGTSMDITELVAARNRLVELEALEASILDAFPHAVIGLRNRRIVFANDGVETVFGWKPKEVIGKNTRLLYPSEKAYEDIAHILYDTLERQRTFKAPFTCRRKDGSDVACMISASRIGESLRDRRIVITYEDITDRRKAEEAYETMANHSQLGVCVLQGGQFLFVNQNVATMLGYSKEELLRMDIAEMIYPEDRKAAERMGWEMLMGQRTAPFEFRLLTRTGQIRWVMEMLTYIPYGGARAVLCNFMDITEQVEFRYKMAVMKAFETSLLKSIPHAVIGLRNRKIVFANEGVRSVFNWDPDDLIGMTLGCFCRSARDEETLSERLLAALEAHPTFTTEFPCRRRDGTAIDCMIRAARMGRTVKDRGIVITYEDITARKRAELELERSHEQLRQLSAHLESVREKERTHIARELHDELGQLLTALNTDLILLNQQLSKRHDPMLEKTQSMGKLVDMLMDSVKRIYTDLRPSMLDHLGIAAAIGWQAEEFQRRTGIACRVAISPEDIALNAELSTAIFRIFQETLTNVVKHAAASKVSVRLRASGNQLTLAVRDDGRGITEAQMAKPRSFGLLGIQERAYHLGGKVKISGAAERGTIVHVTIPLRGDRSKLRRFRKEQQRHESGDERIPRSAS